MHVSLLCFTSYTRDGFGFAATGKVLMAREGKDSVTVLCCAGDSWTGVVMHCSPGMGRKDKKKTVCFFSG